MPRPSRRFVATVLFTDVVGSTEVAASVGDERWHAILRAYYDVARREVRRYRGREIDTAGDGFFAAFDAPTDGVHCAMAIVEAMWTRGVPLRAGLHTGECELVDGKVGGIAVHIGARVASLAGAGEVLVTGTVHDLATGARLTFAPRGTRELRGVPGEWNVFGVEPDAGRPDLPPLEAQPPTPSRPGGRRRTGALVGAGAGAVAVAILVAVLATRGSRSPAAAPSTPGSRPVTSSPPAAPGPFLGTVALDPKSGEVVGRVPMPLTPNTTAGSHDLAPGSEFLWTADFFGNVLHKVNPRVPSEVGTVNVRAPEWVAVWGHDVWVASGYPGTCSPCQLVRVDDRTNSIVSSRDLAVCCGGMVIDHGFLWVLGADRLFRVKLDGGQTTSIPLGGDAIGAGGGRVWILSRADATATPVDEAAVRPGAPIALPGRGLGFIAYAQGALWVTDTSGNAVIHVPISGQGGIDTIPVGGAPTAVTVGDGSVWVANSGDGSVSRIEPIGATVVKTYDVEGQPDDVAVAFGRVWVADVPPS